MDHRLYRAVAPIAQKHAWEMSRSFEALCYEACTRSAMAGALVAQGASPGAADAMVKQYHALGLTLLPELRGPAVFDPYAGAMVRTAMPYRAQMPIVAAGSGFVAEY